jgi:hypothetical protein
MNRHSISGDKAQIGYLAMNSANNPLQSLTNCTLYAAVCHLLDSLQSVTRRLHDAGLHGGRPSPSGTPLTSGRVRPDGPGHSDGLG